MYSKPIQNLIAAFSRLPSVGPRTAERYVFYILKSGKKDASELAESLRQLIATVKSCAICCDFSDQSPCNICADTKRDRSIICVVQEPQDVQAIEHLGSYKGLFHVLRGIIKPDEEPKMYIKTQELLKRIEIEKPSEIIFALNSNLGGETTMMYLEHKIAALAPNTKITRLARGLPSGGELQYADDTTLENALKHRTSV